VPVVCICQCVIQSPSTRSSAHRAARSASWWDIVCHWASSALAGVRMSVRSPFNTLSIYCRCMRAWTNGRCRDEHPLLLHPAPCPKPAPAATCLNAVSQSTRAPHCAHARSLARFCRKPARILGELPVPTPLIPMFGFPLSVRGPVRPIAVESCGSAPPSQCSMAVSPGGVVASSLPTSWLA
jgi:hypothetical protein